MNTKKLFLLQKELDERIAAIHQLQGKSLFEEKLLALQVELGELANETRCFKFWSNKPASEREIIIEEYVDGVHFILSIGLDLHYTNISLDADMMLDESLVKGFLKVNSDIVQLQEQQTFERFNALFQSYINLGNLLGFSPKEIEQAYVSKNNVNHKRQDDGY